MGLNDTVNRLIPTKIVNFEDIKQVSCGGSTTAFINNKGEVYIFGTNMNGNLTLSPSLLENFIDIQRVACGLNYIGFITAKNDVYMWGKNIDGRLGLSDEIDRDIPTKIPNFSAVQISCNCNTAFITSRGQVYVCGYGLGPPHYGSITTPTLINHLTHLYDVCFGINHSIFLIGN